MHDVVRNPPENGLRISYSKVEPAQRLSGFSNMHELSGMRQDHEYVSIYLISLFMCAICEKIYRLNEGIITRDFTAYVGHIDFIFRKSPGAG